MATAGKGKKPAAKDRVGNSDFYIPPLPVVVADPPEPVETDIMGWIAACVLIALLLPLMGALYLDILETKHEAKAQVEKVEKLRRELEREKRDQNLSDDRGNDSRGGMPRR